MEHFFTELGRTVSDRWKKQNFSLAHFPELAQAALEEQPPSRNVDLSSLIRDFLLNDEQPFQSQSDFGQPELVLYDDPRFYIQALFWLEGATDIHQHKFSGAFHVQEGSSIHSQFGFENSRSISAHFRVGDLRMKQTELLETGQTVPIISGRDHIHSLFHLDTPSVSIVVRTHTDPGTGPQFTYLPPHVAVDPFFNDALTRRRKQLLDLLEKTDDATYPEVIAEMLSSLDFERGFFILQNGFSYLQSLGRWDEAWEVFEQKHGSLAVSVVSTLHEIQWRDAIVASRSHISDVEHRFFLALLLNVPSRSDILNLVSLRFTGPPRDTIMRWAQELTDQSELGASILDAEFPEELGVPVEEQGAVFAAVLRCLMDADRSTGAPAIPSLSAGEIEAFRSSLMRSSLRALVSP